MDIVIREIQEPDIIALAVFEREISIISFGEEAITDLSFHEQKIRKSFEKETGGMFVLVIHCEICGWLWMDAKTNFLTQEKYINFRSFYIIEKLHGGAESEALMKHGLDYCKSIHARSITGKVHVNNIPMRALYKNFGFKPTHLTMEYTLQ